MKMTKIQITRDIEKITDEFGKLHEETCELNSEDGSYSGCSCDMRGLVEEVVDFIFNNS